MVREYDSQWENSQQTHWGTDNSHFDFSWEMEALCPTLTSDKIVNCIMIYNDSCRVVPLVGGDQPERIKYVVHPPRG